jgi:uncharacterized protein (TIGR03066 family)
MKYLSVAAIAFLLVPTVRCEDKPDYAKLIVGKWEATKSASRTLPDGTIIEFTKDGNLKASIKISDKTRSFEGSYVLDGDKLKIKFEDGEMENSTTTVKISETEMSIKGKDGYEIPFKRMK